MPLSRRLTMHLASAGPKQHHQEVHHATLTRKELVDNTKFVRTECDTYREHISFRKAKGFWYFNFSIHLSTILFTNFMCWSIIYA